ncbi:MAG: two-component system response regulator CreB [bacterium]|nr:two-component system response regulator CreB [bacterium]
MKKTILIVEDEPGIADTITYALTTEGFNSFRTSTGEGALEKLNQESIDLILLDVGLPDISGFELIKEIRKTSEVPVLFLTARSEEIDRVLGLELGADDYVVKPFSPRELTARIKAVLRRSSDSGKKPQEEPAQASLSESTPGTIFEVDKNKRQISYCGEKLSLSRYEYEILCLFIGKPGWVFSRDTIMDMVWEEPEESFDRTVDAHIKTIRAKLKAVNPDVDPIETHRGVGYALREKL